MGKLTISSSNAMPGEPKPNPFWHWEDYVKYRIQIPMHFSICQELGGKSLRLVSTGAFENLIALKRSQFSWVHCAVIEQGICLSFWLVLTKREGQMRREFCFTVMVKNREKRKAALQAYLLLPSIKSAKQTEAFHVSCSVSYPSNC